MQTTRSITCRVQYFPKCMACASSLQVWMVIRRTGPLKWLRLPFPRRSAASAMARVFGTRAARPRHMSACVCLCECRKAKKRQAPGRCLLHILIRLASFSFLLGAQALTTSAAAARCQRLPAPVHQLPFPSQQVSCGPPPRSAVCSVPETGMRSGLSSPSARWTCQSDERTDSLG